MKRSLRTIRTFLSALCAAAVVWITPSPSSAAEIDGVFLLVRAGSGYALEKLPLAEGQTQVVAVGPGSDVVSVVLPPSPGRSSSMDPAGVASLRVLSRRDGVISLQARGPDGGPVGASWSNTVEALEAYDIRLSVTGDAGRQAFLIRNYDRVEPTAGPVFNPFAQAGLPRTGETVVETDTSIPTQATILAGTVPMKVNRLPLVELRIDGRRIGLALVDTGAATTVISASALPEGTRIVPVEVATFSTAGRSVSALALAGAGGTVEAAGEASLARLSLGDVEFGTAGAIVMNDLEERLTAMLGEKVVAIVGLDLLARAPRVVFDFRAGLLRFADTAPTGLPMAMAGQHLFVDAEIDGRPAHLLVDTGFAGALIQDPTYAEPAEGAAPAVARGLDQAGLRFAPAPVERLVIGDTVFHDVAADVGHVPLLQGMRNADQHIAILGSGFLARFSSVGIDFRTMRLDLVE